MSSILTNNSAMNALSTLRNINQGLDSTQNRISTGLKVNSGKDNAAYFAISESMKGDSSMYNSINESLTLTKNSIATARLGAETINGLAQQFVDKIAFAQGATGGHDEIWSDLNELVKQMETTLSQSTFNGDDMLSAGDYFGTPAKLGPPPEAAVPATTSKSIIDQTGAITTGAANTNSDAGKAREVVTGVSRASGSFATTKISVDTHDIGVEIANFKGLTAPNATNFENWASSTTVDGNTTEGAKFLDAVLVAAETSLKAVTGIATKLGQSEAAIEGQQEFLNKLTDNIDSGVGSMVDANMEEEAARLQALQVQQQLATQSLSMANQKPQNILSLFR